MLKRLALVLMLTSPAMAQQQLDQTRAAAALPYMSQQRNFAMDALAVCNGDLAAAQAKLAELEKRLKEGEEKK